MFKHSRLKTKGPWGWIKEVEPGPTALNCRKTGLMWTGSPKSLPPPHHQRIFKKSSHYGFLIQM
jgi:hypothetical protein